MSNWDDEDWDADEAPTTTPSYGASAVAAAPLGDALGNWDDEDASEEEEEPVKKAPAPMKPAKLRAQKLKQKEEEENKRIAERALQREKEMNEMDEVERKMRQQQIVEEADLENAKDLFMDGAGGGGMVPPAEPTLDNFKPVTDRDMEKFATMIGERCSELNKDPRRTLRYMNFIKGVLRVVCKDLNADDTKDLSTFVGILSNEKRDEAKRARGGKKKTNKKANVRVDRAADMRDDQFDDFADDFM